MNHQMIFQRYELKYLLMPTQKEAVLAAMAPYMRPDQYGKSTIRNIYFDTDTYRLIRRSIERPAYKEKLRLRSYQKAEAEDASFVELKKKYRSVVYKRRVILPQQQALDCLCSGQTLPIHSQIAEEIDYFRSYYQTLSPRVFLSYDREAFYALGDSCFRVTFDENILFRQEDFSFASNISGSPLLDGGLVLMEIKTAGGIPLWMTHCLTKYKIYKTSFSKYGAAYQKTISYGSKGGMAHA